MALYFTKEGYKKQQSLVKKFEDELVSLTKQIDEMIDIGGDCWHDNAGYEDLQERIKMANARVAEARAALNDATIIDDDITGSDSVTIGAKVSILLDDEEERTYTIAAYGEGEPKQGKITYLSPLASSMLGKQKGDYYSCQLGGRIRTIEIIDIQPGKNIN